MQRVAIVPPSPGKAKAVNAKQGGFFCPQYFPLLQRLKRFCRKRNVQQSTAAWLSCLFWWCWDNAAELLGLWVRGQGGSPGQASPMAQVQPGAEHGARVVLAPFWGPALKPAQGPPATLWQHSWLSPGRDMSCIANGPPSSCTSRAASPPCLCGLGARARGEEAPARLWLGRGWAGSTVKLTSILP